MKDNTTLFLLLILFCNMELTAQTTYIMGIDTFSSDCEGTLLDNVGDYAANDTSIFTICTDAADGECLTIRFTDFFTEAPTFNAEGFQLTPGDYLKVYNGSNTNAPLIDTYAGFLADSGAGIFGEITTDGACLTFEFITNDDVEYSGWTANWFCSSDSTCTVHADMAPNNDCENAFLVCEDNVFNFNVNNSGAEVDLTNANDGCLAGEHQSSWYTFIVGDNAPVGSSLGFTIEPENPADYDFAVYGPSIGCGELDVPLRCSWAAGNGPTGMVSSSADNSEGAGGDNFVAPLIVNPDEKYLLIVDNWSANDQGFNLVWNGEAKDYLKCNTCGLAVDAGGDIDVCQGDVVQLGSLETATGASGLYTYSWISTVSGITFDNVFGANPIITPPADYEGMATFIVSVEDQNDLGCIATDEIIVTFEAPPSDNFLIAGPVAVCTGEPVTVVYQASFDSENTYTWDFDGGTETLLAGGTTINGPYQITWGDNDLGTQTISLSIEGQGCFDFQTFTIENQSFIPVPEIYCESTPSSVTYSWDTITGAASYDLTYVIVATDTLFVDTNTVNTAITIDNLNIDEQVLLNICPNAGEGYCAVDCLFEVLCEPMPVGIAEETISQSMAIDVQVYPNPIGRQIQESLTIKWADTKQKATQIRLINTTGSVVQIKHLSQNQTEQTSLKIPSLPKGLYFVEVQFETGIAIKKVVME